MIWKVILVFLCAMALIAMFGKLVFPGSGPGLSGRRMGEKLGRKAARDVSRKTGGLIRFCSGCGKPKAAGIRCPCGKDQA